MSFPVLHAFGGKPRNSSQVTAVYTPETGQLAVSGTYSWDECKEKNKKHIVGFAIFIDDGQDSDNTVGNPKKNNAEALDGAGMQLANDGAPCKTQTGIFSSDRHNAGTNSILQNAPDNVCVVIYDVEENKTKDNHSQIGSGKHRNEENSFEKNGKRYSEESCTVPSITNVSEPQCDDSLWQHVWGPARLTLVDDCKTVSGEIISVSSASHDGDVNIKLKVDPEFADLVNESNVKYLEGYLKVEIICTIPNPTEPEAIEACQDYTNHVDIPSVGMHVDITGSYVLDLGHNGWAEIHPVTSIIETPSG